MYAAMTKGEGNAADGLFSAASLLALFKLHKELSVVKDAHPPCFLGNNNRQGVGQAGNPCGGPMAAPKAQGDFDILPGRVLWNSI